MNINDFPYRDMPYKEPELNVVEHEDGSITLTSPIPLTGVERSIPHLFKRQAKAYPQRVWLGEKAADGTWLEISYADFDAQSDGIAQWLITQKYGSSTPLMILSENSIAHALIIMGAMKARVPIASISAPYSLMDKSLAKLDMVTGILKPALIFAQCGERYANALASLGRQGKRLIVANNCAEDHTELSALLATPVTEQVSGSIDLIDHDSIAKYMFTSGSTGKPKCVVQTQGILCSQTAGIKSILKDFDENDYYPVSLQWMPWSHVSAGNIAYHEAMLKGGAIYIDDGKPVRGLFDKTIDNLRTISTSVFGSAPLGLSWLATALEADQSLQQVFFKDLESIAYGGSALPEDVAQRIQRLSIANTGKRVPIISMYGSTETQGVTATYWPTDLPGVIGLPMPGMELKLVPCANKLEVRAKGPTVLKEYFREEELTRASFDGEGFFKLGDAAKFADPSDWAQGLVFDGRISEDFKLLSGTWVSNATIKAKLLQSFGRLVRDLVICGENQEFVSVFAWLDKSAAEEFLGEGEMSIQNIVAHTKFVEAVEFSLTEYNKSNPGSSTAVKTVMFLLEDASMAKSEINEKGYINTQVLVGNRQHLIDQIYQPGGAKGILCEPTRV